MISPGYNSCYTKSVNLKEYVLQLFFYNRKQVIHQMGDCNWNCELTQYLSNSCRIMVYTQFMAASALFKKLLSIEEWMAAATFVR